MSGKIRPGTEFDDWIARYIMEWPDGNRPVPDGTYSTKQLTPMLFFSPSCDIQDAFEVVTKMVDIGYYVSIQNCHDGQATSNQDMTAKWCVLFIHRTDKELVIGDKSADDLSFAICLSAYQAICGLKKGIPAFPYLTEDKGTNAKSLSA